MDFTEVEWLAVREAGSTGNDTLSFQKVQGEIEIVYEGLQMSSLEAAKEQFKEWNTREPF